LRRLALLLVPLLVVATVGVSCSKAKPKAKAAPKETQAQKDHDTILKFLAPILVTKEDIKGPSFLAFKAKDFGAPCGLNVDDLYPTEGKAGVQLASASVGIAVQEVIRVYGSVKAAALAYNALIGPTGYGCKKSKDGKITITEGRDVSDKVAPKGTTVHAGGFVLTGANEQDAFVIMYLSDTIITFQYAGTPQAVTSAQGPTAVDLAKIALAKLIEALPNK